MQLTLISSDSLGRVKKYQPDWRLFTLISVIAIALIAASAYVTNMLTLKIVAEAEQHSLNSAMQSQLFISNALHEEMDSQRVKVTEAVEDAQINLDALAMRLGTVQAKVVRLEALGMRLTDLAGLSEEEFNFDRAPAIGGAYDPANQVAMDVPDFISSLESLSRELEGRDDQFSIVESMMLFQKVKNDLTPARKPVSEGWISSTFGSRTDPVTGKKEFHKGIDFAGKEGGDVIAVANGIVTWTGKKQGYGNSIEINHGNGFITTYSHNKENLVIAGDTVEKGQIIALLGSTGRSTGPHVHFEVVQNGKVVNPEPYLKSIESS